MDSSARGVAEKAGHLNYRWGLRRFTDAIPGSPPRSPLPDSSGLSRAVRRTKVVQVCTNAPDVNVRPGAGALPKTAKTALLGRKGVTNKKALGSHNHLQFQDFGDGMTKNGVQFG